MPRKRWLLAPVCLKSCMVMIFVLAAHAVYAQDCKTVDPHEPTPAEKAFLESRYTEAANLYRDAIAKDPNDLALTAGLTRDLLRAQRVDDAAATIDAALKEHPQSPDLLAAKTEVLYRQGDVWSAAATATQALKINPCIPRLHLFLSRFYRLDSEYATARMEVLRAYGEDPYDPDIKGAWINLLPLQRRITELGKYLSEDTGDDAQERVANAMYLAHLKSEMDEPRKPCRLASAVTSATVPFAMLLDDPSHVRAFGLEVKLNDKAARLQIDTGADGILITQAIAGRAGLKPVEKTSISGVGDQGDGAGYLAYVDSIRIGGLEFKDCMVEVASKRKSAGLKDQDGLIGMDVFSNFLVTLDYPARNLILGPLPPRPGDTDTVATLATDGSEAEALQKSGANRPPPVHDRYIAPEMKGYSAIFRNGHYLIVPVALNNQKAKPKLFILDSGAWNSVISPKAASEVTQVHKDTDTKVIGLNGEVNNVFYASKVKLFFLGHSQVSEYIPAFDTSSLARSTGVEISGFLGATMLELVTVHIDYRDGLVKLDYDPNRHIMHVN